jgi:DNA uptake protein ComE-like DNA-binding protein
MAREKDMSDARVGAARGWWTPTQRRTLLILLTIFLLVLVVSAIRNPQYISNPQPPQPFRAAELLDKLDPNTASAAELVVLPQLGEKRAAAIVELRQRRLRRDPTTIPFRRAEDLLQVNGIGAAMVETLRPYLTFPTTAPTGL